METTLIFIMSQVEENIIEKYHRL